MFIRQADIIRIGKLNTTTFTIIGCGGIGSPVAISLAKMGGEYINIYDNDSIEKHNIPNQFHKVKDIDENKAESLSKLVEELSDVKPNHYPDKYINQKLSEITIAAVDSMKARKDIYLAFKSQKQARVLIDTRMAGQFFDIFVVLKDNKSMKKYEKTIIRDENALQELCTNKAIIYNTFGIASFVCNIIKRLINNELIYFKYSMDYRNMLLQTFKIENYHYEQKEEELYVYSND